jgi:hypothetical protein
MEKYKSLISDISNVLKPFGFKKSAETFFYNKDNNIGIIDFQKGRSSVATSTLFTINLGIYSGALKVFDRFDIKSKPSISDCHWRKRVGFLLPQKQDYWWEINDKTSLPSLITEITNTLRELAIPEIQKYISDESLEKSWMEGISEGLTEQQMYLYLIALLKKDNKPSLQAKIEELKSLSKGKPFYNNVKENLAKLGITDV